MFTVKPLQKRRSSALWLACGFVGIVCVGFLGLSLGTHATPVQAKEQLLNAIAKQQNDLPKVIRGPLLLVGIDVSDSLVKRHYQHTGIDYGRMNKEQSSWLSSRLTRELFEQCHEHDQYINQYDIAFDYHIQDVKQRTFLILSINKKTCAQFKQHHS